MPLLPASTRIETRAITHIASSSHSTDQDDYCGIVERRSRCPHTPGEWGRGITKLCHSNWGHSAVSALGASEEDDICKQLDLWSEETRSQRSDIGLSFQRSCK